jgi:hypothetical protein
VQASPFFIDGVNRNDLNALKSMEINSLTSPNPIFKLGPLELESFFLDSTILFSLRLLLTPLG